MHAIYVQSLNDKICIVWTDYSYSQEESKMISKCLVWLRVDRNKLERAFSLGELKPVTDIGCLHHCVFNFYTPFHLCILHLDAPKHPFVS